MTDKPTPAELTRAEIARQVAIFTAKDRELTARAAELCRSGNSGSVGNISDRARAIYDRATELMDGKLDLPQIPKAEHTEADILAEREAVRVVLARLQSAHTEAFAIELAEWADTQIPDFLAMCRTRVLAYVQYQAATAKLDAYIDGLSGDQRQVLPMSFTWMEERDGLIEHVLKEGLVTRADLRRARRINELLTGKAAADEPREEEVEA